MTSPVELRAASTVVLLREGARSMEVLLLKRASRSSFMPDAYVYPGGALDAADVLPTELVTTSAACLTAEDASFRVAALRECFEESNLLVATEGCLPIGAARARLRRALLDGEVDLRRLLAETSLRLAIDRLVYFDRWVTPDFEAKRFDARFYLAEVSEGAAALQDDREVVEAIWLPASAALQRHARGELRLFPPTWVTLAWLTQFDTPSAALDAGRSRCVVPTMPHFRTTDSGVSAVLPGHAEHPMRHEEGLNLEIFLYDGAWSFAKNAHAFVWQAEQ